MSSFCPDVGGDLGGLFATNVPIILSATMISRFLLVPAVWSYAIVNYVVIVVGILGTYRLTRRFAVRHWIALGAAFAYCTSLSVFGLLGFGGMLYGALLLPTLAAIVGYTLDRLGHRSRWWVLGVAAWGLVLVSMLFADGYTFMMACLLTGSLVFFNSWGRWRRPSTWFSYVILFGVVAGSYVAYRSVVTNAGAWGEDSLDKFRAFGLDLSTLFVPSNQVWWAKLLGIGQDSSALWGDGSNSVYNMLGVLFVLLAIVGLICHARSVRREVVALAFAGTVALVFALGPALKFMTLFDPALSDAATSMPAGAGILELPTAVLFEKAPGFEYMRAIYRWVLVTRLAVVILAAICIETLLRRKRAGLAIVLAVLAVAEVSFNPVAVFNKNVENAQMIRSFDDDVTTPLAAALDTDERVIFVSGTAKSNDYLSVYLVPTINVRSWNIGNDKALRRARAGWSEEVDFLIARQPAGDELLDASLKTLTSGEADAIVVLDFDLRNSAKSWPPSESFIERGQEISDTYSADARFAVEEHEYFDVVTLSR
ncbi:hypothetical protein FHX48_001743 [Microbacterium halimionae]|uniref:Uncharacterized protein n=2 Tax=Microbacterium halimionae TaxID=1526413 RepID=A0A7W3JPK9_9MICO|nr:hypothetical protein [Microbacterium halimionae]MBA8816670.1 hypothetical protein [Microbacterium halimionae]